MRFLETSKPISRQDINEIEKELNLNFPEEFINHYLEYNGGFPEMDIYNWADGGGTRVDKFMSIKYEGFSNIEETYKDLAIAENYLPHGLVPFGLDEGGNFFCISVRKDDYGYIYYFNNDHYEEDNVDAALSFLNKSFNDFMENLST